MIKIRNKKTGEVKTIDENQLSQYGLSDQKESFLEKARKAAPAIGGTLGFTVGSFLGPVGGVVGAGAGTGAGVALKQATGGLMGTERRSNEEQLEELWKKPAKSAAEAAVLEAVFGVAGKAMKPLKKKLAGIPAKIYEKTLPPKMAIRKKAIRTGKEFGEEALKMKLTGGDEQIYKKTLTSIDNLEKPFQEALKISKKTISKKNILKQLGKLKESYTGIGEDAALNTIDDFVKLVGKLPEKVSVSKANILRRKFDRIIGQKWLRPMTIKSPAKIEAQMAIANTLRGQVKKVVPAIRGISKQMETAYIVRDAAIDKMAKQMGKRMGGFGQLVMGGLGATIGGIPGALTGLAAKEAAESTAIRTGGAKFIADLIKTLNKPAIKKAGKISTRSIFKLLPEMFREETNSENRQLLKE